jgi:membrane-associated phospholipid phosphatase
MKQNHLKKSFKDYIISMGVYEKTVGLARAFTVITPVTAILYGAIFRDSAGVFYGLYAFFGDATNHYVKKGFKKMYGKRESLPLLGKGGRPTGAKHCGTFIHENNLEGKPSSFGMPSGHSQMATLTATFWILYLYQKYGWEMRNIFSMGLVVLVCLGILYSRCYLKCHTVQQVVLGGLFGIIYGVVGFLVYKSYFDIE